MKFCSVKDKIERYPIASHMEDLCEMLKKSGSRCLVLTAETGAGKSTVFPIGLLEKFNCNIVMTEPRRLSTVAVAERISILLDEQCGRTCGYRIHLENKVSADTRLEVVSEAILLRMIQNDIALERFGVVVIDEFHERNISTDLNLAFIKEALSIRDDLFLVVMSATIDAEKISSYLGNAPVAKIPGRTFPVEILYEKDSTVEDEILKEIKKDNDGNILAFLPGIREIDRCCRFLTENLNSNPNVEILRLHSSISNEEQRKVLLPQEKNIRRVVVSSAIAETSLTVPGVNLVIDSGFSRINVYNPNCGMESLETVSESIFSADQRAGRAGRICEGKCIRLWSKNDVRTKEQVPEILRSDLSSLVLECAERGIDSLDKLDLIDFPSAGFWNESKFFLTKSGLLDSSGKITEKGKAVLKLGCGIRLGAVIYSAGKSKEMLSIARELYFDYGTAASSISIKEKGWADILHRLNEISCNGEKINDRTILILQGYSDRLAKKIGTDKKDSAEYQFPSGRKAFVYGMLNCPQWIIAVDVTSSGANGVIRKFQEVSGEVFDIWLKNNCDVKRESVFDNGKVSSFENTCFGKIILSRRKLPVEKGDLILAWNNLVKEKGISVLPLSQKSKAFLLRAEFFELQSECKNKVSDLSSVPEEWLSPFLNDSNSINEENVYNALYWYLNGQEIDIKVPESIILSNGVKIKISYERNGPEDIRPVSEVIIQRVFGCLENPKILQKNILFRLLSPARRPLQVTEDLANFWTNSWPEICREMKGRYPKHNWDYRVAEDIEK